MQKSECQIDETIRWSTYENKELLKVFVQNVKENYLH